MFQMFFRVNQAYAPVSASTVAVDTDDWVSLDPSINDAFAIQGRFNARYI